MKTVNLTIEVKMNGITVANIPMSIDVKMDNENEAQHNDSLDFIPDRELSIKDCCYITNLSDKTFRRYIEKGELKYVRHGRKIFIDSNELKNFMRKHIKYAPRAIIKNDMMNDKLRVLSGS